MKNNAGILQLVDDKNRVIGKAPRNICHGNPALVHRSVHIIVVNSKNMILLQKRSKNKDVQPGKWDTTLGTGVFTPNFEEEFRRFMEWKFMGGRS